MAIERKLAVWDFDNTMREGFLFLELSEDQERQGLVKVGCATKLHEDVARLKAGEFEYEDFAQLLLEDWAEGLEGTRYNKALSHAEEFIQRSEHQPYPFVRQWMRILGVSHDSYIVTAEPQFVAEAVTISVGAKGHFSTHFNVDPQGVFMGSVGSSLARGIDKLTVVDSLLKIYGKDDSVAFGDSIGDMDMLDAVENAVCVQPSDELREVARSRRWLITNPKEMHEHYFLRLNPGTFGRLS